MNDSQTRKVALLPADWVMMKDYSASNAVREYAEDQDRFHSNFVIAFEKVLNRGYKEDELKKCKSVKCQHSGDKFTCEGMNFKTGEEGCIPGSVQDCELIGGAGIKGVINCDSEEDFICKMI